MHTATRLVRFDPAPGDPNRPTSTPIHQTATFAQPGADEDGPYDYSRSGNPTRAVLEAQLARLEQAERAFAYASGMAALSALLRLVPSGGRVLAAEDLYGGTHRLLERVAPALGIHVSRVDACDLAAVEKALHAPTQLVLVESPGNPLLRIADIRAIAGIAHRRGALLAVDNSLLSPILQNPLELGADVVAHSGTKHLGGHGDVTAGVLAVRRADVAATLAFHQNAEGTALAPFDAWLLLRGLKTLHLRVEAAQRNATEVARFLATRREVTRLHWPGVATHPGRDVHERQARGPGSVMSFETGCVETSRRIVDALRCFTIAVSFGNVASSVSLPCRGSHRAVPAAARAERGLGDDLVRLSIGVEDPRDLIADLAAALDDAALHAAAGSAVSAPSTSPPAPRGAGRPPRPSPSRARS